MSPSVNGRVRQGAQDIDAKYANRIPAFKHTRRQWPDAVLKKSPVLFSTDLRDGNQALRNPLTLEQKLRMFQHLVSIGFKEIEVALPFANQAEFDFVRYLVNTPGVIPDDVLIQVITPARREAIQRTVDSVQGAKQAILFLYMPSSDNYRETMLDLSEDEWVARAREMTTFARSITKDNARSSTHWTFSFGFEDYANARLDAVVRCAEAVYAAWQPTLQAPMMFAIASSVESSMVNVFADQVEMFCQNVPKRDTWRLSIHTHNDRGGAVAAAELGSLAGADRVEGCMFGNGERAGNMDLVTYGLNRLTSGLHPGIDFTRLPESRRLFENISPDWSVHLRTPYSGAYCLKAFSGIHQDAIIKGLARRAAAEQAGVETECWPRWRVPYLPFDPSEVGMNLDHIFEINNQSGKAGVRWVVQECTGHHLSLQHAEELTKIIKQTSINLQRGLSNDEVCHSWDY
ncbi:uncharacterized protein MYCFIDRAFT_190022 [Pseudocercospora fijiensis CIRAD86]|uniref:2-isopropylmalate synthase n=1 Tax=Pseudocercospora fijiensis (strain CIRAD86) TaxID=383855 RepID=M3A7J1_PSEFD|nr:uncharacterized protein MYCFIDRAFT_190022 [Pseudocercospora fijiensis CIRAD86]EME80586.1 hypothetical protein MYCFIDRAFT_190022 [Pseudocercospora fijiensis CIRAD86]